MFGINAILKRLISFEIVSFENEKFYLKNPTSLIDSGI